MLLAAPVRGEDIPLVGDPIDEGSTSQMTMLLADLADNAALARDIACYVDDAQTQTRLYDGLAPTPALGAMTVTLPAQANQIVTDTASLEEHTLTCIGRYPFGCIPAPTPETTPGTRCSSTTGEAHYLVRNLRVVVGGVTPQPSPAPTGTPAE